MALGLQAPWQVKDVTFSTDELAHSELHLHISFAPGSRFPDETNKSLDRAGNAGQSSRRDTEKTTTELVVV
jgi:hypothetical protein